jgi:hypothetical protein
MMEDILFTYLSNMNSVNLCNLGDVIAVQVKDYLRTNKRRLKSTNIIELEGAV